MGELSDRTAVVADRQPLWLDALSRLVDGLGVSVMARSTDRDEAIEYVKDMRPDMFVLGLDGAEHDAETWEQLREVRSANPDMRVVVMSSRQDDRAIEAAFAAGVSAYCMRSAEPDDLMVAIRQSFHHSIFLATSRKASVQVAETREMHENEPELTKREMEILRLVAEGYSNSQLARMLWVTEQTVKFHLSNIYRKLDVSNRTEASRWAQLHGLLSTTPLMVGQTAVA